jgi:Flp pilus assembly protein TadG
MSRLSALLQRIGRFRAAQGGAAAVEFALILPIMLMLYIGANEASVLISMDRKVQMVSGAVGDLVARSEDKITTAAINDYVKVAGGMVWPYTAPGMVQIVTQVKVSTDGKTAIVDWSKGYRDQALDSTLGRAVGSAVKLPDAVLGIAPNQYVIVAETSLPYTPLYGIVYTSAVNLYRENYYLPRFGNRIELQ